MVVQGYYKKEVAKVFKTPWIHSPTN